MSIIFDPIFVTVWLGVALLSAAGAVVGTFLYLKKETLVGDAISHSVLPGICVAFMLYGTKNELVLIGGALIASILSLVSIRYLTNRLRVREDSALSLVLSVFFGFGIFLLTIIQASGNAEQAGLDKFLFGKAAAMTQRDVLAFLALALLCLVIITVFFKELKLVAFDAAFAKSIGINTSLIEYVQITVVVLSVTAGIQALGVVLTSALLIIPAACARYWTNSLVVMIGLSLVVALVASFVGVLASTLDSSVPTGPSVVLSMTLLFLLSFFIAPENGALAKAAKSKRVKRQMLIENVLKSFYQAEERQLSAEDAMDFVCQRIHGRKSARSIFRTLCREGYLVEMKQWYSLSTVGRERGARITRLHRLWELYLTQYLRIAPDHVHDDAEKIEHIITPDLERQLEQLLGYPESDPHLRQIPYRDLKIPGGPDIPERR